MPRKFNIRPYSREAVATVRLLRDALPEEPVYITTDVMATVEVAYEDAQAILRVYESLPVAQQQRACRMLHKTPQHYGLLAAYCKRIVKEQDDGTSPPQKARKRPFPPFN